MPNGTAVPRARVLSGQHLSPKFPIIARHGAPLDASFAGTCPANNAACLAGDILLGNFRLVHAFEHAEIVFQAQTRSSAHRPRLIGRKRSGRE